MRQEAAPSRKTHNIWSDAGMLHHLHLWPKFSKISPLSFQNSVLNAVHSAEAHTQPWHIRTGSHTVIFNISVKESEGFDLGLKT